MKIIEKLEALIKLHSWDHEHANGDIEKLVSVDDLRAIIEEYKNAQEPGSWQQVPDSNPYKRLTDQKASHIIERDGMQVCGYVLQKSEGMAIVYNSAVRWLHNSELFNFVHCVNPPLSDETVKDAERLNWLQAQSVDDMGWCARLSGLGRGYRLHQDPSNVNGYSVRQAIDEAMKADNVSE